MDTEQMIREARQNKRALRRGEVYDLSCALLAEHDARVAAERERDEAVDARWRITLATTEGETDYDPVPWGNLATGVEYLRNQWIAEFQRAEAAEARSATLEAQIAAAEALAVSHEAFRKNEKDTLPLSGTRLPRSRPMSDQIDTDAVRLWLSVMTDDAEVIEKVAQLICSQGPWERVSPYNRQRAREMAEFVTPIVGRVLDAALGDQEATHAHAYPNPNGAGFPTDQCLDCGEWRTPQADETADSISPHGEAER